MVLLLLPAKMQGSSVKEQTGSRHELFSSPQLSCPSRVKGQIFSPLSSSVIISALPKKFQQKLSYIKSASILDA
jgi:hypothetical protein